MVWDTLGPLTAAFVVSAALSPAGISGAFLLLPYQVSVLGLSGPAVTPTNHLFNVVAAPSGILRYARDGRIAWPLALVICLGAVPGAVGGSILRMRVFADPIRFKVVLGGVLLVFAARLAWTTFARRRTPAAQVSDARVEECRLSAALLEYRFAGAGCTASVPLLGAISVVVGVIGGMVGVGGGSLLAPLLVSVLALPVHSIAGATLLGTFASSLASIATFALAGGAADMPDWRLGLTMGAGGLCGTWLGAILQRRFPARAVEGVLTLGTLALAATYLGTLVR
jgi:uncharacterized membrane protein YfcA